MPRYWLVQEMRLWQDQVLSVPGKMARHMKLTEGMEKGSVGFLPIFEVLDDALKLAQDPANVVQIQTSDVEKDGPDETTEAPADPG